MSLAYAPPPVSLRELARVAWERQQAEEAERKRQEIQHAEGRLTVEIRRALRLFTVTYDPFSPLDEGDVLAADLDFDVMADGIPYAATVTFAGEVWRYTPTPNCGGQALHHQYVCPRCGLLQESTSSIGGLADLGYWLEYAPTLHRCEVG